MIFATSFVVAFSGAMVPGPLLTFTISEAIRGGFITAPLIMLGHAILELVLVLVLLAGFSVYLQQESVFTWIALLGGAFLLYMGYTMIRDAWQGRLSLNFSSGPKERIEEMTADTEDTLVRAGALMGFSESAAVDGSQRTNEDSVVIRTAAMHPAVGGFLLSLANPFWSIWWVSVGLGYITLSMKNGIPGVTSFYMGHILADVTWYCMVAAAVAGGRKFLSNSAYRLILIGCGFFLILLGGYFIYMGINK
ncbi:MAG: LysE family transporter [Syntrophomonadaceae bacterium]|nr:LysE family transporter [Syntrophomonadaceae bacterium]